MQNIINQNPISKPFVHQYNNTKDNLIISFVLLLLSDHVKCTECNFGKLFTERFAEFVVRFVCIRGGDSHENPHLVLLRTPSGGYSLIGYEVERILGVWTKKFFHRPLIQSLRWIPLCRRSMKYPLYSTKRIE